MGAIASVNDLVSRMSGGSSGTPENIIWHKSWRAAGAAMATFLAGKPASAWLMEGQPGDGAVVGSSIVYPTNVTAGGMKQTDPSGGRQKWLTAASFIAENASTIIVYDRLAHIGGLVGNVSTNQSVASTITRYTNGLGNWLMLEVQVQGGSPVSTSYHMDYTDENNASITTDEAQIGAVNYNSPYEAFFPPLKASAGVGGRGVKNMTNFKLNNTSLGSGFDMCASIIHPLFMATANGAGMCSLGNWMQGNMPIEILTDACLGMLVFQNATNSGYMMGSLHMVEA